MTWNDKPCKLWPWSKNEKGYGFIRIKGVTHKIHRVEWEKHNGRIPNGICILHHCDQPSCYEITHLFSGTNTDNRNDSVGKLRHSYGERHGMSKLTSEQVKEIREKYVPYMYSQQMLADEYKVSRENIGYIVRYDSRKLG